jgi:hypothetical protein
MGEGIREIELRLSIRDVAVGLLVGLTTSASAGAGATAAKKKKKVCPAGTLGDRQN